MGDIADYLIEQEMDAWFLHLSGACGEYGICQYCEEESNVSDKEEATGSNSDGQKA